MRYADPSEVKKFGKTECVTSVLVFLLNYLILVCMVVLFLWIDTQGQAQSFREYVAENYNTVIYLLASVFLLVLTIYFYYVFEDKTLLASPKSIWLIFILLDVCILICYFSDIFSIFIRARSHCWRFWH